MAPGVSARWARWLASTTGVRNRRATGTPKRSSGATSGSIVVTTKAGSAKATPDAIVWPCQATAAAAGKPLIQAVIPQKAKPGKKLRLLGAGFVGTKSVTVGGEPAPYAIPSDNLMYVRIPADAKAGQLTIEITNTLGSTKSSVVSTG